MTESSLPPGVAQRMPQPSSVRGLWWVALLGLVVAVLALVACGLLWQKLGFTRQELARRSQDSAVLVQDTRRVADQSEALVQALQARVAVAELRLSEVSVQRTQMEELMRSVSRSRDDTLLQDLESALQLAVQQSELTGSAQPLISALRAAEQRIGRAAQPRLNPVQRAIVRDIERIQMTALVDVPTLVARLDALARQVDDWPLANAVGQPRRPVQWVQPPLPVVDAPSQAVAVSRTVAAASTVSADAQAWWSRVWTQLSVWWQSWWASAWSSLTRQAYEVVRVSRIDRPEAILIAPDQAVFLRENLKLKLLNARLGVLARQTASSQADVLAAQTALERYFDTAAPAVRNAQRLLAATRQDLSSHQLPQPEETLLALAGAAMTTGGQ